MRCATAKSLASDPNDPRVAMTDGRLHVALSHLNNRVASNKWLAGDDFTAADVMTVWCLTTVRKFAPFDLSEYQGILDWVKRCTDRPTYRKAMSKGDPELNIEELISPKGPSIFEGFAKMMGQKKARQKL